MKYFFGQYRKLSVPLRAGIWFTLMNFLQKSISMITVPIFTRIMTGEEYGIYSVFLSYYNILIVFTTLNLSYYVFNTGMVKFEDDKNEFVLSLQSLSTTATILFLLIYIIFKDYINVLTNLPTSMMLLMFVLFLLDPSIRYWTTLQRYQYKYNKLILVTLLISILNPIIGILLVTNMKNGALGRVISMALITFIFGSYFYIYFIKKSKKIFSIKYWLYSIRFNLPLIPHFLSTNILNHSDRIMINNLSGPVEAGLYSVAYSAGMISLLFNSAIHQSLIPWLYKKLKFKEYNKVPEITYTLLIIVGLINLLVISFSPEIISFFAPKSYQGAVQVIPPIAMSVFFIFLYNIYTNIEYYYEETRYVSISTFFIAVLNILFNWIFINLYGFLAAGYTTLVSYVLMAFIHYKIANKIIKNKGIKEVIVDSKIMLIISIVFTVLAIFMSTLYNLPILRYSFVGVILLCVFYFRKKIIKQILVIKKR